jgi:hypothetical protein
MTNVIDHATNEAKQYLHRTWDPANPHLGVKNYEEYYQTTLKVEVKK